METMVRITKKERRQMQLNRHYRALEDLATHLGMDKPNGKKLSLALLRIETEAHRGAEAHCNGETLVGFDFNRDEMAWEKFSKYIKGKVKDVFGGIVPPGFFVNGDPRGCALKIDSETQSLFIKKLGLYTDWGGYGLLAPEITGD